MSYLDTARKVYARHSAASNGHPRVSRAVNPDALLPAKLAGGEISEKSEKSPRDAYRLITDAAGLRAVVKAVASCTGRIAVDTETTGLDPRKDRVRLLQLATDKRIYLVDCFVVDPSPLWPALAGKKLIGHNLAFDEAFLALMGLDTSACLLRDTMILSALLTAGDFQQRNTLEAVAKRYLGIALDKSPQKADWSAELTPEQLAYAVTDAATTRAVYRPLLRALDAANLRDTADLEHRALPAILWLSGAGIGFDKDAWTQLAEQAEEEAVVLAAQLAQLAPAKPPAPPAKGKRKAQPTGWNWNSPKQIQAVFAALGITLDSTSEEALAAIDHPLADLLRRYRAAAKRAGTYGRAWLDHIGPDGRLRCHWKQSGTKTGRMACGKPNLQNLPKEVAYRRCFVAPPGRVLLKADYSQIELRIAARVANEEAMIAAFQQGADLHTLTAQQLTGREDITLTERQMAKPINFGLIYGLGAPALARKAQLEYGVEMSQEQAEAYRAAWFTAWPGIAQWHKALVWQRWQQLLKKLPAETRTLTGRRTLIKPDLWHGARANFIVQGSGGDGIKAALALLWERRADCPHAIPVLAVHDEIVIEADADQAEAATAWLTAAMKDAMAPLIDPVPVEVEVAIGRTWGGN